MDLKEFVTQTLTQIIEGVRGAQIYGKDLSAEVNPELLTTPEQAGKQGFLGTRDQYVPIVQFDVALTVTEGTGTKGGIGVFAGAISLGSLGQSQNESSSVSRVKFSIPIRLPNQS